jgi:hypothetical protein
MRSDIRNSDVSEPYLVPFWTFTNRVYPAIQHDHAAMKPLTGMGKMNFITLAPVY